MCKVEKDHFKIVVNKTVEVNPRSTYNDLD